MHVHIPKTSNGSEVKKEGQKIEVGLQEARAIVIIFVHHSRWVPFGLHYLVLVLGHFMISHKLYVLQCSSKQGF
jgi:hypothetical protein